MKIMFFLAYLQIIVSIGDDQDSICMHNMHMVGFVVEGFFGLGVVIFFATLRADLEDCFKCMT